jgi:excisionase family DNA binding protein
MKHTLGTAAKATGVSKSTVYRAVKSGKLSASRNIDGEYEIDPAELHRVYEPVSERAEIDDMKRDATASDTADDTMLAFMREQVIAAQAIADEYKQDAEQARAGQADITAELLNTKARLNEHREAARSLMSPEQFSEQVEAAVNAEREKAEAKSREWKQALAERSAEIESARMEAAELSGRLQREADKVQHEADERAKAESLNRALRGRGFIARLLNRQPDIVV